jgi:kanamycin kinase/aminoglycoside 3'-phosphotransferase-2
MEQNFIDWAKLQLGDISEYSKETHGDQSLTYRLTSNDKNYFLKIGLGLDAERERLEWLDGRLPVPKVIGFTSIDGRDALLLSALPGQNLAKHAKDWPSERIVRELALALRQFHATSIDNCPFGTLGDSKMLVHGDACLPNFIFQDDTFSGYIDLGEARVDYPEVDLSAAIWSLQRNLGGSADHGINFLKTYGYDNPTEEVVEKLRLQYEETRRAWGLK